MSVRWLRISARSSAKPRSVCARASRQMATINPARVTVMATIARSSGVAGGSQARIGAQIRRVRPAVDTVAGVVEWGVASTTLVGRGV